MVQPPYTCRASPAAPALPALRLRARMWAGWRRRASRRNYPTVWHMSMSGRMCPTPPPRAQIAEVAEAERNDAVFDTAMGKLEEWDAREARALALARALAERAEDAAGALGGELEGEGAPGALAGALAELDGERLAGVLGAPLGEREEGLAGAPPGEPEDDLDAPGGWDEMFDGS